MMASSGRGGRGGRRGWGRGGGSYRYRGPPRDVPPQQNDGPPPSEELGHRVIENDVKKILIEVRSNEQGRFFRFVEEQKESSEVRRGRGKVIFSMETGESFRRVLNEVIVKVEELEPASKDDDTSERLLSLPFNQGRRKFFVDLRKNQRGYFMKLTQLSQYNKIFVAIPIECLTRFQECFLELLEEYGSTTDASPPRSPQGPPLPEPREIRAGGKSFFFDVERNDRGVYLRLTESLRTSGRRARINIPNSCWSQMADTFSNLHREMPYTDSASGSGSEDN